MALVLAALSSQIDQVFEQTLSDISTIAMKIALAYQMYATTAQGSMGDIVILKGTESSPLREALYQIMANRIAQAQAAQKIGNAVMQFWLTPPAQTALGGVATSIITPPAVAKITNINAKSYSEAAQDLASALDMATKTVIVTYPPLIGPPGLIQ